MVVTAGDTVDFTLTNGSSERMAVNLPHSMDFHSAEVNPGTRYVDLAPGRSQHYRFVAKHPGVYMYHCATQPVLHHTGNGMVGMMVVKPKNLAPVDRELWTVQQEYYIGKPGAVGDLAKMQAKAPDVIAFNGYAEQYKTKPIAVRKDEKVRMYVLNAGPSIWSAFHVIGTVFDKVHTDNGVVRDVQTVNLAPSQGGWVEFTLYEEGGYPFVTHAFGDAVKGAIGVLPTTNAPRGAGHDMGGAGHAGAGQSAKAAADADVDITLGDMFIKASTTTMKAGRISFAVKNEGQTMHGMAQAHLGGRRQAPVVVRPPPLHSARRAAPRSRRGCRTLDLEHVEGPQLARGADGPAAAVLRVTGCEVRPRDPRLEVLLRAPARQHEADLAVVVGPQQLERLEARGARDTARARGEATLELVEVLPRHGDRVDLDDAHRRASYASDHIRRRRGQGARSRRRASATSPASPVLRGRRG